jgi:hypothetical protein
MNSCPACGAENYPGAFFCEACGAAVHPAAANYLAALQRPDRPATRLGTIAQSATADTQSPPPPRPAPPPAAEPRALRVRLPHHDAELIARGALIHVGRADPEVGFTPEIDLTEYGGQERGVSRRHATIQWVEGGYVLTDQNSSNGTWLNGVRLVTGYAYQLPPGANVRFGGLLVQLAIAD